MNTSPHSGTAAGGRLQRRLARRTGPVLAPYLTAGDGGLESTLALLRACDRPDVGCVELGLPFTDPVADGPVLVAAADRALASGTTFAGVLDIIVRLRAGDANHPPSELPLAVMTYANLLMCRGWDASLQALAGAGADALLVADVPVEEGAPLREAAAAAGLCPIFFVSPSTSEARLAAAIEASAGFVYAIGRFGVTGAATRFDERAGEFLARVKAAAGKLPVAVGFGIGSAEAVAAAGTHADLVIVGSALVDAIHRAGSDLDARRAAATQLLDQLSTGLPT